MSSEIEGKKPAHVAIIMDGNGRWAKKRGQIRVFGHNAGMGALKEIVRICPDLGIDYLTVYAFSTENWKRPQDEVSGIFSIMVKYLKKELKELMENNVRIQVIGHWETIPDEARAHMLDAVEKTKNNAGLVLSIALNYGGRSEIARAARAAAEAVKNGEIEADRIDEDLFAGYLYTAGVPDPDLIIRTGGEKRLSNFLLWQCAYSEFIFSDVLWPDFGAEELKKCLEEFNSRHRRYGGL